MKKSRLNRLMAALALGAAVATTAMTAQNLVIIGTNDTHSQIDPDDEDGMGGVLRRKVIVDSIRSANPNVLLVDMGDPVQGTMYFNLFGGQVENMVMDSLGYDIRILGNHDFDNGVNALADNLKGVNSQLLSTNYRFSDPELASIFHPYLVRDIEGRKVAFLGINLDPKGIVAEGHYDGVTYLDAIQAANATAWHLKHNEGVDKVIALTHLGYWPSGTGTSDRELAAASRDIDIIMGGHSHTVIDPATGKIAWRLATADNDSLSVTQSGKAGKYVAVLDIDLSTDSVSYRLLPVDSRYDDRIDAVLDAAIEPYRSQVEAIMQKPVGRSAAAMARDSDQLLNFLADFIRDRGNALGGGKVDFAIINKGGIRRGLPKGTITQGQIQSMLPFNNKVVVMEISGRDILDNLKIMAGTGGNGLSREAEVVYDPITRDIIKATVNGQAINPDATYRVATIDYLANGGDYMQPLTNGVWVAQSPNVVYDDLLDMLTSGRYKGKTIKGESSPRMYPSAVPTVTNTAEQHRKTASSFTALVNNDNTLPIGNLSGREIAVVIPGTFTDSDNQFLEMCRRYSDVKSFTGKITPTDIARLKDFNDVLLLVTDDDPATLAAAESMSTLNNVITVFLVSPDKMAKMSDLVKSSKAVVFSNDNSPLARHYAPQAIFGGIKVEGRLQNEVKGLFKRGSGIDLPKTRLGYSVPELAGMKSTLTDSIDALMNEALSRKAIPGAQVLIARHGQVVLDKAYGLQTEGGEPVTPFTVYDLASVSKAIGTLPGVMVAVDQNLMDIEAPLSRYIPGLRDTDKADLKVKEFLFHETGMPAALNMFTTMMDTATYSGDLITSQADTMHPILIQKGAYGHKDARLRSDIVDFKRSERFPIEMAEGMYVGQATVDTIMGRIYASQLRPTKDYNYSCLNFALLMDGEQNATGQPHDLWSNDKIWAPLGAWTMGYRPSERLPKNQIAPTEKDTYLRKQTLRGYVHDEMADFLGGVSGNAGLFANADDIAKICQMWLNNGSYGGVEIMSPETVELFTKTVSPTCRRGLGFDKPDVNNPDNSPTTELANASTFGHLGFTGTVFWVDPDNDMIVVFLTNRVNPTRDNIAFSSMNIRPDIMKQALLSIDK